MPGMTYGNKGEIEVPAMSHFLRKASVIDFKDVDPLAIKMMVDYFYHLDYPYQPPGPPPPSVNRETLIHVKVYALGVRYSIGGLKTVALRKFDRQAWQYWATDEFRQAMEEVYTSTAAQDRTMRDIVLEIFDTHSELCSREAVGEVLKKVPGLDYELHVMFRERL
ncbi:hypothetical protein B0H66DRAFT_643102 [Apodospora peruviana]|uniref:BTB domain-containing protein n=1 Tax=Apodospora peruviana TaxID=516989 RepID=A0AAE0LZP0_9PEZI|nr:hypothetical protein B0H66DRAFT_643102 [Apodospora peruviana]